ncbi:ATP-binding protein [candidate division WOR-3 bacterium]|nr:ATP-binding protein [candidate division WOR-3 bacterium]
MKEIVVISGKGGTGKTSLTASFAFLSKNVVVADCDVDAADLHLVLNPKTISRGRFKSGNLAVIDPAKCISCGKCELLCKFEAVILNKKTGKYSVAETGCEGCGVCVRFCPVQAIGFPERDCGEWFVSEVSCGKMVHARLDSGAENSGKLVSLVRKKAKEEAEKSKAQLIIVDGPPGIGCPVIASVTGADAALIVTEPSLSGEHDLERVADLAKHFRIPIYVCVNKWDINPEKTRGIEQYCVDSGVFFCGKIHYDKNVTEAQVNGRTVVEYGEGACVREIINLWETLCRKIL